MLTKKFHENWYMTKINSLDAAIVHNFPKPDGTPRKLVAISALTQLGKTRSIHVEIGIALAYAWFTEQMAPGNVRAQS